MINFEAFQLAALKSERYRIVGLLCLLGALMVYAITRGFLAGELRLRLAQTFVLILVIAYEAMMLRIVQRAVKRGQQVPGRIWVLNVLIETQLPTITLLLLIENRLMAPAQVLVAPAVLLYFLFIILSTLRLSPGLSLLTGIMSALGYLGVVVYGSETVAGTEAAMPLGIYFVYAGLILAGGAVAAVVAGQIRVHVYAALREAELQRELERVNQDLETARSIQQGLLPTELPGLEDFDVAGWNQPADQTGGDYFDWQTLPDGRLAISLGDATGHGIGPALVTASCRAYARASFLVGEQEGVLNRLNQLLAADLPHKRWWRTFSEYGNGIVGDMCVHMYDTARWMLGLGWPKRITSAGGIYVQKEGKSNISDTQTATFEHDNFDCVWQHRTWGSPPDPDYPWALCIYGEKGTLKASTMRADFIPLDKNAKTIHFDCFYEREKYPEDVTEKDNELNAAPATRKHMLDFLGAIEKRSRPIADIEEGHISTASCILANIAMEIGRPIVYDPKKRVVVGDRDATKLLRKPYRAPWRHPGVA